MWFSGSQTWIHRWIAVRFLLKDSVDLERGLLGGFDAQPRLGAIGLVEEYGHAVGDQSIGPGITTTPWGLVCSLVSWE